MPACLIGMEACVGAHHFSRQLLALGNDVKLIPVQFVIPFRKSHKRYHDGHGGVGAELGGSHGSNSGLGSSGSSSGN
jgi:hypothetical protein